MTINNDCYYLTRNGSVVWVYYLNNVSARGKLIHPEPTEAFHRFIRYKRNGNRMSSPNELDLIKIITEGTHPELFI